MMAIYSPWEDRNYPAFITVDNYANNNRIAVQVWVQECEDFAEPWASLTVNLDQKLSKEGNAFIDTNNFPGAEAFIEKYHLGEPTGHLGFSGYCVYPEYKLDLEELDKAMAE